MKFSLTNAIMTSTVGSYSLQIRVLASTFWKIKKRRKKNAYGSPWIQGNSPRNLLSFRRHILKRYIRISCMTKLNFSACHALQIS